jgi:hypothetical protein
METASIAKKQIGHNGIQGFYLSELDNTVYVMVDVTDRIKAKNHLQNIINMDQIKFTSPVVDQTVYPGEALYGSSTSINHHCSAGFKAQDSDGVDVLVTAGHCFPDYTSWYEDDGTYIGDYKEKVTSTFSQQADSGTIKLTGSMSASDIRTAESNEMVGETIYLKAASGTTSGKYDGENSCYTNSDGFSICNAGIVRGGDSVGGDSGGMYYTPYVGDGGGYNLKGTHNAEAKDGSYRLYSRIKYIFNELNLTGVYIN